MWYPQLKTPVTPGFYEPQIQVQPQVLTSSYEPVVLTNPRFSHTPKFLGIWLSRESELRLICLGRQLQKGDLTVDFSSSGAQDTLMSLLCNTLGAQDRSVSPVSFMKIAPFFCAWTIRKNAL